MGQDHQTTLTVPLSISNLLAGDRFEGKHSLEKMIDVCAEAC